MPEEKDPFEMEAFAHMLSADTEDKVLHYSKLGTLQAESAEGEESQKELSQKASSQKESENIFDKGNSIRLSGEGEQESEEEPRSSFRAEIMIAGEEDRPLIKADDIANMQLLIGSVQSVREKMSNYS